MKINNFRGDLTDISAKKEALLTPYTPFGTALDTMDPSSPQINTSVKPWTQQAPVFLF